jgi:hypothetical protein
MSQATLADDDLFGEAAAEVRADVEEHLAAAQAELPAPDDVWAADADNALGVLNGLRSALAAEDALEHLRAAKKWHALGERADAFEDDGLEEEIAELEALLGELEEANEAVGDLAATLPEIRQSLEDAESATDDGVESGAEPADTDAAGDEAVAEAS